MFAQKPHLKLVRAQHFADEKIISAIVAKFYRTVVRELHASALSEKVKHRIQESP
jgi:hypothetical protein